MSKTIFSYQNVLKAYLDCRKRKRGTLSALGFECDLENNLLKLTQSLQQKTYTPARSVYFVVTKPKPREIFASEFVDRIAHHLLINEVERIWERDIFIADSYACRAGKGHHKAMQRVSELTQDFRFYGQFDISNFFSSINQKILFRLFAEVISKQRKPPFWKDDILWLSQVIIFSDPTNDYFYKGDPQLRQLVPEQKSLFYQETHVGMPIGNLSSQFLANVYLNELDHYATKTLKVPGYARYVDDFVILSNSKKEIIRARKSIEAFLANRLAMTLHPKKQQIQPARHGIPFVGYFVKPTGVTVRRNVVKRVKSRLHHSRELQTKNDIGELIAALNSYYGHFRQARSYNLRRHLYKEHLPAAVRPKVRPVNNYSHFRLVKKR